MCFVNVLGGETNRTSVAAVNAIAGSILTLVDSLSLLAHGFIPFKFDGSNFPFLDGMCNTLCPATATLSAYELREGWRNLSAMNDVLVQMNAQVSAPNSRAALLKLTCEKLSLTRYNIDYEAPNAVCTWANVRRVLLHSRLILNPAVREEVARVKEAVSSKHSLSNTAFAVLQVSNHTLSHFGGDDAAAVKYWTAFLESRNIVPCCIRKVLLVGDTESAAHRLVRGIKALERSMTNPYGIEFISVVVVGEVSRSYDLKDVGHKQRSDSSVGDHDSHSSSHRGENKKATSTTAVFAELWALLELMSQADIVILDELSEVGQLVNLMRFQFPNRKTPALFIHNYLVGTE